MIKKNSGLVYAVGLDHELGYTLCKFVDFTDISPFDGGLIYTLKILLPDLESLPSLKIIEGLENLFGPVPLNKYPNVKGKGAWKLVGKMQTFDETVPIFKSCDSKFKLISAIDWSTVDRWAMVFNFKNPSQYYDYEKVRHLEMKILFDMAGIVIRSTMQYLLMNGEKVENYYDLTIDKNRRLYIQMVNTSYSKKDALKYLKALT